MNTILYIDLELSNIELKHIINMLNGILIGYYVSNIYQIDEKTILFKLHHGEKPEKRLVVSAGKGLWLTKYMIEPKEPLGLIPILRRNLVRAKISRIEQPEGERIAVLHFNANEGLRKFIGEFFGEGNLILTDQEDRIISTLKRLKVRHREIFFGKKYVLPPLKGFNLSLVSLNDLIQSLDSKLEISRWLGRNLSISKKFVEEILARSEIDPKAIGTNLTKEDIRKIYLKINEITKLIEAYDAIPIVILENGRPIDALPFKFLSYQGKDSRAHSSYVEAIDEVFIEQITSRKREIEFRPFMRKIKEMNFSIEEQIKQKERILTMAEAFRNTAIRLSDEVFLKGIQRIEDIPDALSWLKIDELRSKKDKLFISIKDLTLEVDKKCPVMKFVSRLYDEAKSFENKATAIELARESLIAERDSLVKKLEVKEVAKKTKEKKIRRERLWFERYRWFITSDNLLAVGGRDATSNTTIIRRHMDNSDVVFHADIPGSPFFILKGVTSEMVRSIHETAQAVASYSRAWKEGFAAVDAYYVYTNQVKMQAPSGMYLPKGSFLIEGRRNYIKSLEIKIAIGLHKRDKDIVIMGGPISAVRKNSLAYVIIEPEKATIGATAKRIKSALVKLTFEKLQIDKDFSLDDIARALPGGGVIIFEDLGEQSINVK